jgi:hypothetical protein
MEPSPKQTAELLAVRANIARSRLSAALGALDRRGREALDLRLQLSRHAGLIRTGAVVCVTGIVAFAAWRVAMARRRRGYERWRMLRRVWSHPELAAQPKASFLATLGRAVLGGLASFFVTRLIQHSGPALGVASPLPQTTEGASPAARERF